VVTSGEYVRTHGKKPMARLVAAAAVGCPPEIMGIGPAPAIRLVLERAGLTLDQIDRFEINEAQGAQTLAVGRELGLDLSKLNVNGGAIALGHPVGCSGAFIATKAIYELHRSGGKYALVTMCIGGGQGIAVIFERL
jgi:acetyl-CoA C-acetyltransferase